MSEFSFIVRISDRYTASDRSAIGESIVNRIKDRTRSGLDKDNRPFKGYAKSYVNSLEFKLGNKRQGRVDLELSGDMLIGLDLLAHGSGYIKIGFASGEDADKARWNAEKGREILGLMPSELDRILDDYPLTDVRSEQVGFTRAFADEFLKSLFGK